MNDVASVQITNNWNSSISNTNTAATSGGNALDQVNDLVNQFGAAAVSGALFNRTMSEVGEFISGMVDSDDSLNTNSRSHVSQSVNDLVSNEQSPVDSVITDALEQSGAVDWFIDILKNIMSSLANENEEQNGEGSTEGTGGGGDARSGGGGGLNWLETLAKGLAEVQSKWLDTASDQLAIMDENSATEDANGESIDQTDAQRNAFVIAQSRYTAATQMFSMTAAATSTSLKTIGEGLSGIARKQ